MKSRRFVSGAFAMGFAGKTLAENAGGGLSVAVVKHSGRGGYGHELDTMWLGVPGVRGV